MYPMPIPLRVYDFNTIKTKKKILFHDKAKWKYCYGGESFPLNSNQIVLRDAINQAKENVL